MITVIMAFITPFCAFVTIGLLCVLFGYPLSKLFPLNFKSKIGKISYSFSYGVVLLGFLGYFHQIIFLEVANIFGLFLFLLLFLLTEWLIFLICNKKTLTNKYKEVKSKKFHIKWKVHSDLFFLLLALTIFSLIISIRWLGSSNYYVMNTDLQNHLSMIQIILKENVLPFSLDPFRPYHEIYPLGSHTILSVIYLINPWIDMGLLASSYIVSFQFSIIMLPYIVIKELKWKLKINAGRSALMLVIFSFATVSNVLYLIGSWGGISEVVAFFVCGMSVLMLYLFQKDEKGRSSIRILGVLNIIIFLSMAGAIHANIVFYFISCSFFYVILQTIKNKKEKVSYPFLLLLEYFIIIIATALGSFYVMLKPFFAILNSTNLIFITSIISFSVIILELLIVIIFRIEKIQKAFEKVNYPKIFTISTISLMSSLLISVIIFIIVNSSFLTESFTTIFNSSTNNYHLNIYLDSFLKLLVRTFHPFFILAFLMIYFKRKSIKELSKEDIFLYGQVLGIYLITALQLLLLAIKIPVGLVAGYRLNALYFIAIPIMAEVSVSYLLKIDLERINWLHSFRLKLSSKRNKIIVSVIFLITLTTANSLISYNYSKYDEIPESILEATLYVKNYLPDNAYIFNDGSGLWIPAIAYKRVTFYHTANYRFFQVDSDIINLYSIIGTEKGYELMLELNITHIFITYNNDFVFRYEFSYKIFNNKEIFKIIYSNEDTRIFEVMPRNTSLYRMLN